MSLSDSNAKHWTVPWEGIGVAGSFRSVSVSVFRRYLDFAGSAGVSHEKLLAAIGGDPVKDSDLDARVEFTVYQALVQESVRISQDPSLPLRYPGETRLDSATIVGLIIQSSKTLAEALREVNRYAKLMMEIDIMAGDERHPVEVDGDTARFLDARPDPNAFPELTEIAFGRIIFETAGIFPEEQFAKAVHVTHPKPAHADLYENYWKCPVTFGAPLNAVEFDSSWLGRAFDHAHPYALTLFSEKATELKRELEGSMDLRSKIEGVLLPILHLGATGIDKVASDLGLSRSTLYRQLKEEGITFAEIHDDLRRAMALDYLTARKVSIKETAYLVGFSEPSSFNRAFRRWTGRSPKSFIMSCTT